MTPLGVDRPRLRLVPAPRTDGLYDDERSDPSPPLTDGSLALAFPPPVRFGVPLRLVPPAGDDQRPASPVATGLPDPRPWCARLCQAIAEVLAGARPAHQLADVASLDVLQLLERSAGRLGGHRGGPVTRPRVASVHVSEPTPGIAEACAVVDTGPRRRALAIRVEGHPLDGRPARWRCTALHVG
jgi:hypothetical protein